ncbi:hypothetical protein N24_1906 [Corynebacterium suranareeae]|uniref:Uncharacterized protein n=1 Tax=Corynebacterium suranareeae TaxID=2506452 RepID=A0A161JNU8_9CORY|nr:hypothetical protein N24_1906 [Corynebacterium suranareeae]
MLANRVHELDKEVEQAIGVIQKGAESIGAKNTFEL